MSASPTATPATIPEFWPTRAPAEPRRACPIPWFAAPVVALAACLFPRRLGPHLAASSWFSAYAVHAVAVLFIAALIVHSAMSVPVALHASSSPAANALWTDFILEVFASLYFGVYSVTPSWIQMVVVAGIVFALEAGIWAAAIGLGVFISIGERAIRTWLRGVKSALWSTMAQTLPAWAISYIGHAVQSDWGLFGELRYTIPLIALLGVAWWLSVLVRMGARHFGPRDGVEWQPRPPRCERCGYTLTGLSSDGRCPECGRAIAESLPDYREPPAFARATTPWRQLMAFPATVSAALRTRAFGVRLSVRRGWDEARRFALLNCLGIGVLAAVGFAPYWVLRYESALMRLFAVTTGLAAGIGAFCVLILLGTVFVIGRRDVLRRSIVVCYSSVWLYPSTALGIGGFWVARWVYHSVSGRGLAVLPLLGPVDRELLRIAITALFFAPALIDFSHLFRRTIRLLNATRYANG